MKIPNPEFQYPAKHEMWRQEVALVCLGVGLISEIVANILFGCGNIHPHGRDIQGNRISIYWGSPFFINPLTNRSAIAGSSKNIFKNQKIKKFEDKTKK